MAWLTLASTIGAVLATTLGYIVQATFRHRRKIYKLRKQGIARWSWIFGHLLVLQKCVDGIPPDAAVAFAMRNLSKEFADTELFLMDVWPVYPALYMCFGPEAIHEICVKYNLPKTEQADKFMHPVAGGPSLLSMNGGQWKYWRSLFNPGFSSGAMLDNVPHIVDSVLVFRQKLFDMVGKGFFSLDELTTRLTMEIILKVSLDHDSNYQQSDHVLATALGRIIAVHSFWNPFILMNPLRPIIQNYNGRIMDKYIRAELDKRFQEAKLEGNGGSASNKSVIALALKAYFKENEDIDIQKQDKIDPVFAQYATSQIRVFLFAGNDTTASMMVYVYHRLSKHPKWLAKLRQEHDEVFGSAPADAADRIKESPSLLNKCPLTLAVIKETMRLHAPAGTMRWGAPGTFITDLQGNLQPMDDSVGANILHQALHLNPRVWPRADEFLPERFLVGPEDPLYPVDAAYRPFEAGPRNCIGQTLVWNELKVAVILTCRELQIRDAYAGFDAKREREMGWFARVRRRLFGGPIRTLHGDRAYQSDSGGLHPVDGYPCYVSRVEAS
ncbi:unnamed protein product [Clonostachys chloroleuca]|uniref:Cytochrome P450 n=1 Tax=Clonostachys chloroleuca TaxID=1926264 RepID=A0AA35LUN4_9HYPO|nr:unnamed protein product [Clonostachys chloroleuca]